MIIRLGCLCCKSVGLQTRPEQRLVHRKDGETHVQTYHIKPPDKPPPGSRIKKKDQPEPDPMPGDDLTLMKLMRECSTEESARKYIEKIFWPNGPVCLFCGGTKVYVLSANPEKRMRPGRYKCAKCRKVFTVTMGTVMEDTKLPLHKWLWAFHIMCASKTQVSALQLQRQLEIASYQTAMFVCHRARFAVAEVAPQLLDGTVEVDEMYVGGKVRGKGEGYVDNKTPVISAVERGGKVRSQVVHDKVTGAIAKKFLDENVAKTAHLNTDEARIYIKPGKQYASHDTVRHKAKEYVRLDRDTGRTATTNTAEGYFGNTKNSIRGTHHHISPQHTGLFMAETDYKLQHAGYDGRGADLRGHLPREGQAND